MKKFFTFLITIAISFNLAAQKSIKFDGSNDYVSTTSNGILGTGSKTIELWIKTSNNISTQQVLVDMGNMSIGQRFTFNIINFGKLRIEIGGNGFNSSGSVADGKWHHVAVTFNNSLTTKARLYIDGTLDVAANFTRSVNTGNGSIILGRRNDNVNYYNGEMDEIRVWNTDLSQNVLRDWMCQEVGTSHPNVASLFGYWKMDTVAGTIITDYSGNIRNGTLNGGVVRQNFGAPLGSESVHSYGASGSLALQHPDGDSVVISSFSGAPDGIHLYRRDALSNGSSIPATIGAIDSSRHWGVYYAGGTNASANLNYYYANNSHFINNSTCTSELLTRNDNSVNAWSLSGATNSNSTFALSNFTTGEIMIGYGGGKPIITSAPGLDTVKACFGDSILLSNSTTGFSYQWLKDGQILGSATLPTRSVTSQGNYALIVSHGTTCSDTSNSIRVEFSLKPTVSFSSLANACASEFSTTLTGGVPAGGTYLSQYVSGNLFVINNSGPGTFDVVYRYVDQNGCGDTAKQTITIDTLPNVSVTQKMPVCIDSAAHVLVGGMPAGGSYFVNGSSATQFDAGNLGVGNHKIRYEFTDANSCAGVDSISVQVNPLPVVNNMLTRDLFCNDEGLYTFDGYSPRGGVFSGNGVSGFNFNTTTAGLGIHAIRYDYTDRTTSCSNFSIDTVEVLAPPARPTIIQNGNELESSVGTTYQWYDKDGPIFGETNQTYKPTREGNYSVVITNEANCESENSEVFAFEKTTNVLEVDSKNSFVLYPNPSTDVVNIDMHQFSSELNFNILNSNGNVVQRGLLESAASNISVSELAQGIYLFQINTASNTILQQSFVVE